MLKNAFKILAIFILGIFGGIFGSEILWPYFVERPLFLEYRLEPRPVYLTQKKEIRIQENVALQGAIEKVEKSVVGIETKTKKGKVLEGSGMVAFREGLIITLFDLVPEGSTTTVFFENQKFPAEILKRDKKENLALLKIQKEDLQPVSFGDFEKIKLGQRVFLVGVVFSEGKIKKVVNEGILKYFDKDFIETNIAENEKLIGSSLFDIDGNFLGLNFLNEEGKIVSIPILKIKSFAGI
jgi:S1-C subfamily serine protease